MLNTIIRKKGCNLSKVLFIYYKKRKKLLVRLPGFEPGLEAWEAPVLDQARPQPLIV